MVSTKTIAVLIAEFVGFTEFAGTNSPDERSRQASDVYGWAAREVLSFGGSFNKDLDDGLMATFGAAFPTGRDASNAIRCACNMVAASDELNGNGLKDKGSAVAIGVHCGIILLGDTDDETRPEFAPAAEVTNVAIRLKRLATFLRSNLVASDVVVRQAYNETAGAENLLPVLGARSGLAVRGLEDPVVLWTL